MKLNEQYIETWEGYADEHLSIYHIYTSKGGGAALVFKGKDHKFVAAFDNIETARDAIIGYPVTDQDGKQWSLEKLKDGLDLALMALQSENAELKKTVDKYATAARSITLNLEDFCDRNLPYDQMIAEAARKASAKLEQMKAELDVAEQHSDPQDVI